MTVVKNRHQIETIFGLYGSPVSYVCIHTVCSTYIRIAFIKDIFIVTRETQDT
jgi:hypothetical protein